MLAQDGINKVLRDSDTFVCLFPQLVVTAGAMEESDENTLLPSNFQCRNEVAVPGKNDRFLNLPLGGKQDKIDSEKNINSLLLKSGSLPRSTSPCKAAKPHHVPW